MDKEKVIHPKEGKKREVLKMEERKKHKIAKN